MSTSPVPLLQRWLRHTSEPSAREIAIAGLGALIAIALTAFLGRGLVEGSGLPFLVASMGASAVILYALPNSPMAQPWPLIGGHIISACVGVTCARYIPEQALAAATAAAGAMLAMHFLRCMHPPGGATALMPIAAAKVVGPLGYGYVLAPVGLDVALMLALALLINNLLLRRPYPGASARARDAIDMLLAAPAPRPLLIQPPFAEQDLERAIHAMDTYVDVSHGELQQIYSLALLESYRRRAGQHLCGEIMEPAKATLAYGDDLASAFKTFQSLGVDGLPVTGRAGHLEGVVSLADFLRHAEHLPGASPEERMRRLLLPTPGVNSDKPEVVGQIMDATSPVARHDQALAEVIDQLNHSPAAIVPVLDAERRVVGVLRRHTLLGHLGVPD